MPEPNKKLLLVQELQRLKLKKNAVDDKDIKQALQLRIDSLEAEVAAYEAAPAQDVIPVEEAEEELKPATPEQIRRADELIRQARVEKIRKNNSRSLALMKEASEIAPTAPTVLEALGDDLVERRLFREAKGAYEKALKFSKNNVELERKHATVALRAKGMGMLDPGARMDDPLFLTPSDSLARVGAARLMNAFIPGVGHLVMGKTAAGLGLIGATVLWTAWLALMGNDVKGLLQMLVGKSSQPNLLIMVPLFGYLVTWIIGIASVGGVENRPKAPNRPQPPVNLPFE